MLLALVHLSDYPKRIKSWSKSHPIILHIIQCINFGTPCWGETQDVSMSGKYTSEQKRTCLDGPWLILEMLPLPRTNPWLGSLLPGTKVSSRTSVEDRQEKILVRLHYLKGILCLKDVCTLSIILISIWMKIHLHALNLVQSISNRLTSKLPPIWFKGSIQTFCTCRMQISRHRVS